MFPDQDKARRLVALMIVKAIVRKYLVKKQSIDVEFYRIFSLMSTSSSVDLLSYMYLDLFLLTPD